MDRIKRSLIVFAVKRTLEKPAMKGILNWLKGHKTIVGSLFALSGVAVHELAPGQEDFVKDLVLAFGTYLFGAGFHPSDHAENARQLWGGTDRRKI